MGGPPVPIDFKHLRGETARFSLTVTGISTSRWTCASGTGGVASRVTRRAWVAFATRKVTTKAKELQLSHGPNRMAGPLTALNPPRDEGHLRRARGAELMPHGAHLCPSAVTTVSVVTTSSRNLH